jgi:hypothetical protein
MKNTIGQILRILGLVIEMWGIYGVFGSGQAPGQPTRTLPMIALVLGFVMWITGTVVNYYAKQERKRVASREPWL